MLHQIVAPGGKTDRLGDGQFIGNQGAVGIGRKIHGASLHDSRAIGHGVAGIDQLGLFLRELADVKEKKKRSQTGRQHEQPVDQGLTGLTALTP